MDGLTPDERRAKIEHEIRDVLNVMAFKGQLTADEERGWPGRIKAAWVLINQPGGLAILMLLFAGAIYTGYLSSPLTTMAAELKTHDANVRQITGARQEIDKK